MLGGGGGGAGATCTVTYAQKRSTQSTCDGSGVGGGRGSNLPPNACAKMPQNGNSPTNPNGKTFDQTIAGSPELEALTAYLANAGELPSTVTVNNNPEPDANAPLNPASVNPTVGSSVDPLIWNSGDVQRAIDSHGADPAQILWGEFEHIYFTLGPMATTAFPQYVNASINGSNYTFRVWYVDANGNSQRDQAGLGAVEHLLSHDDAVAAGSFGTDKANFLAQALEAAGVDPTTAQQIAASLASSIISLSANGKPLSVANVPSDTTCASSSPSALARQTLSVTGNIINGNASIVEQWI